MINMDEYYIHVEYTLPYHTMRYYCTDTQDPKQAIAEAAEREGCKPQHFVYVRWLKVKRGKPFDPFDQSTKKPKPKPFVRPAERPEVCERDTLYIIDNWGNTLAMGGIREDE